MEVACENVPFLTSVELVGSSASQDSLLEQQDHI